jgi:hypothetical protein
VPVPDHTRVTYYDVTGERAYESDPPCSVSHAGAASHASRSRWNRIRIRPVAEIKLNQLRLPRLMMRAGHAAGSLAGDLA